MTESFNEYLNRYGNKIEDIFNYLDHKGTDSDQRGIPREVMEGINELKPSAVSIPKAYGGRADYWLMTAREELSSSELKRDIDFFVCDSSDPAQYVKPIEKFSNLGLYMIPYALNDVKVTVPAHHRLVPLRSGIRLMQDLLHRSRMRFSGMASGFIHRMLDEAVERPFNT